MLLTSANDPTNEAEWCLLLGPVDACLLLWPVVFKGEVGADAFFELRIDDSAAPEVWPFYGQSLTARSCVWASPASQANAYKAPAGWTSAGASLKLVSVRPAEPWMTCFARNCCWGASLQQLRQLAKELPIPDVPKSIDMSALLEKILRRFLPGVSDVEIYEILMLMAPPSEDIWDQMLSNEDLHEMLEPSEQEALEKHVATQKKRIAEHKRWWSHVKALKEKCLPHFQAQEAALACELRARGPVGCEGGEWTQSDANAWAPAGCHVLRDAYNARWRCHWPGGDMSRSWGEHGYHNSLVLVLRAAWIERTAVTGIQCTVPGIFAAAPDPVVPAAKPKAKGKAKAKPKPKAKSSSSSASSSGSGGSSTSSDSNSDSG